MDIVRLSRNVYIVRRYKALTGGGVRKAFEKDANKLAAKGYHSTNTVDHTAGRYGAGHEMIVTYELGESG